MATRSAHKHDVGKDVLMVLETGGLLTPDMFRPEEFKETVARFWRLQRHSPAQIRRSIKYLAKRGLIAVVNEDGLKAYRLTEKGRRKVRRFELLEIAIPIPLTWDGKWRLVLFDIPENRKSARNALSLYLRSMGLYKLQDSVWLHPYPLEGQISALRHALDLSPHVRVIAADSLENDQPLKEHFHLS